MTDEEKEAIEIVKGITEDDLLNYWEGPEEPYNAIQTLLNLIEKQSKEIEELKEVKWYYEISRVPKNKIKAIIEEIKSRKIANEEIKQAIIDVLQSLLEKE